MPDVNRDHVWSMITDKSYLIDIGQVLNSLTLPGFSGAAKVTAIVTSLVATVVGEQYGIGSLAYARQIQFIANELIPEIGQWFYGFHINPSNVSISEGKLQTRTDYGWGMYDLEHFGNAFTSLTVRGTTGVMFPSPSIIDLLGVLDTRLSSAYARLLLLEKLWKESNQRLIFILYGRGYFGYLDTFEFGLDAENPRKIDYTFTFKAHPQLVFDIFNMDFSGIPDLGYILDPSSIRQSSMFNTSAYGVSSQGIEMVIPQVR